jgi:hypothetical protein
MKTFTITMYTDSGHGWGKVKRNVLQNLGIEDLISPYSYEMGDNVYLEEDCDLSHLRQVLSDNNVVVRYVEKHTDGDSRIRGYESFKPLPVL